MSIIQGVIVCRECAYEAIFNDFTSDGLEEEMLMHLESNPIHVLELVYRLAI